jgi:microcystin-dependent protein
VEYIVNGIALIRKEQSANKPNVLQTPKNGTWSNDFNINSGEWWIFRDNNNNTVLRNIGSPVAESGTGAIQAALVSANQYKDFTINLHLCMPDTKMDFFQWQIDDNNRVIFTYDGTNLQIIKNVGGVSTEVATTAATVAAGDNYHLKLTRNQTGFFLTAIRNNSTYYALSCNIADFSAEATGSLAIGERVPTDAGSKTASIKLMEMGLSMKAETAFNALMAANVSSSINGKAIADIFESDGVTAKKATLGVPVGVILPYPSTTVPPGWLLCAGKTIGDSSSGGTARANDDTQSLFEFLWNNIANNELSIQNSDGSAGTRGANAAEDFNVHKRLPLPDLRGRVIIGADNMGGSSADVVQATEADVLGKKAGEEKFLLSINEIPSHYHYTVNTDETTENTLVNNNQSITRSTTHYASYYNSYQLGGTNTIPTIGRTSSSGSGSNHNNMQPYMTLYYIIRY